ncbi:MAG: hypothetical protein ABR880_03430 [Candidatus Sulfotelmatobacter sp.]|jgi:hypothetical protein
MRAPAPPWKSGASAPRKAPQRDVGFSPWDAITTEAAPSFSRSLREGGVSPALSSCNDAVPQVAMSFDDLRYHGEVGACTTVEERRFSAA